METALHTQQATGQWSAADDLPEGALPTNAGTDRARSNSGYLPITMTSGGATKPKAPSVASPRTTTTGGQPKSVSSPRTTVGGGAGGAKSISKDSTTDPAGAGSSLASELAELGFDDFGADTFGHSAQTQSQATTSSFGVVSAGATGGAESQTHQQEQSGTVATTGTGGGQATAAEDKNASGGSGSGGPTGPGLARRASRFGVALQATGASVADEAGERDANLEFFSLTTLAVKIEYAQRMGGEINSVSSRDLWRKANEQGIQFHQYHRWIEKEISKAYISQLYSSMQRGAHTTGRATVLHHQATPNVSTEASASVIDQVERLTKASTSGAGGILSTLLKPFSSGDDEKDKAKDATDKEKGKEKKDDAKRKLKRGSGTWSSTDGPFTRPKTASAPKTSSSGVGAKKPSPASTTTAAKKPKPPTSQPPTGAERKTAATTKTLDKSDRVSSPQATPPQNQRTVSSTAKPTTAAKTSKS